MSDKIKDVCNLFYVNFLDGYQKIIIRVISVDICVAVSLPHYQKKNQHIDNKSVQRSLLFKT